MDTPPRARPPPRPPRLRPPRASRTPLPEPSAPAATTTTSTTARFGTEDRAPNVPNAGDDRDGAHAPVLARRDTLVPSSHTALWAHAPSHTSAAGPIASLSSSSAGPLTIDCDSFAAVASLHTPRPHHLRPRQRPLCHTRTPSRSRSRSRSPSRSRSTSPPPSTSSAFASAQSMSASWQDDETSAAESDDDDVREPKLSRRSIPSPQEEAPKVTLATLPHEILLQILRFVQTNGPADLTECLAVNRRWCYAGLELVWYKHTFHSPRVLDRMISILAHSTGQTLPSRVESALAILQLSDHSSNEPYSSSSTAGALGTHPSDAIVDAPDPVYTSLNSAAAEPALSVSDTPLPPQPPQPQPLQFAASSSTTSFTSGVASVASLSAHEAEPERPEALFPYCEYVRRINCCLIGKDIVGPRAEAFRALAHCSQLERLTLAGAKNIPDEILRDVLPKCTAMVAVDLTDVTQLTDETLEAIAVACPRLQGINLTNCTQISSKSVVPLALHCPLLRRVKLGNCPLVTNSAVVALARNCRHLLEIDLTGCTEVSDEGVAAIWRHTHVLRELKLTGCVQLTALGFPAHNAGLIRRSNILPNGIVLDNEREDDLVPLTAESDNSKLVLLDEDDVTHEEDVYSSHLSLMPTTLTASADADSSNHPPSMKDGSLSPSNGLLPPRPPRIFEQLRILDLGNCSQLTDSAIEGIINHSPKLRNLVLSKCSLLTDDAIYAISRLGKNLHYLHLGRCEKITDRAVKYLARTCTRLRYIDLAYCPDLTDAAVREIGLNLPKLRRIGLVKVQGLTDAALISLVERHTSLERIHLSYCDKLTVPGVYYAVLKLNKLTHLSLTGVPAFRKKELQRMCRAPPPEFNEHQRATFCVYSGRGVHALRDYLSVLYLVWRRMLHPSGPVGLRYPAQPQEGSDQLYIEAAAACHAVNAMLPQDGERAEDAYARAATQAANTLGVDHMPIPASQGMSAIPPSRASASDMADPRTVELVMETLHPSDQFPRPVNGDRRLTVSMEAYVRLSMRLEHGGLITRRTPGPGQGLGQGHGRVPPLITGEDDEEEGEVEEEEEQEDEPQLGLSAHTHAQAQAAQAQARSAVHARDVGRVALARRFLGINPNPNAGAADADPLRLGGWVDVPVLEGSTLRSTWTRRAEPQNPDLARRHLDGPFIPNFLSDRQPPFSWTQTPHYQNQRPSQHEQVPRTMPPPQSRAAQWALDPQLVARLDRVLRGEHPSARPR